MNLIKKIKENFSGEKVAIAIGIGSFAVSFFYSLHKYNGDTNNAVLWQSCKNAFYGFILASIFIFGIMKLLSWIGKVANDK